MRGLVAEQSLARFDPLASKDVGVLHYLDEGANCTSTHNFLIPLRWLPAATGRLPIWVATQTIDFIELLPVLLINMCVHAY